jgi:hypothetical protein
MLYYHHDDNQLDLLWGVAAISNAIRRCKSSTAEMLERGEIPSARKVGSRWCVSRQRLAEHFKQVAA